MSRNFVEGVSNRAVGSRGPLQCALRRYCKKITQAVGCRMHGGEGSQEGQMEGLCRSSGLDLGGG